MNILVLIIFLLYSISWNFLWVPSKFFSVLFIFVLGTIFFYYCLQKHCICSSSIVVNLLRGPSVYFFILFFYQLDFHNFTYPFKKCEPKKWKFVQLIDLLPFYCSSITKASKSSLGYVYCFKFMSTSAISKATSLNLSRNMSKRRGKNT